MLSRLTPLIKLFFNPFQAMEELAVRRPYILGGVLALIASTAYHDLLSGHLSAILFYFKYRLPHTGLIAPYIWLISQFVTRIIANASPVLFLIVVFVPACLFAASKLDRRASFGTLLRREYGSIVSCALYAWTVAHLLTLIPAAFIFEPDRRNPQELVQALQLVPLPYFVLLVMLALKVVLHTSYGRAIAAVALGALSLIAIPLLSRFLFLLTSPLLLIFLIILFRNFFSDMMATQRARENFEHSLEAATLNPADASAHYNLGLIYQERGQIEEAKACFRRAIEIRPDELDAHYQLGRIAREENRLGDAIAHFDAVVREKPDHSQNEIWREIGHTYFQAGQYEDARAAFERFIEKRPSDAEGRFRYGLTLYRLGRSEEAASEMRSCIEAVRTSPAYKYRTEKRWMDEAESFLRSSPKSEVRSP